ncbi:MAG: bacterial Ig-like domain-containing protein, partial [Bacteroidales bacterium]|nr:bacterial Ig-like domain-containing protein [Bacteroidales bacterium]
VTQMAYMFKDCSSLTTLDLSNFITTNIESVYEMFNNCTNLQTIFVGEGWNTSSVTGSQSLDMFANCTKLYGGKGTAYTSGKTTSSYAHIDGGAENPGYFTKSGEPAFDPYKPYAIVEDGVATFYSGVSIPEGALKMRTEQDDKNWTAAIRESITKVVFDKSFKGYTPYKLSYWFSSMANLTELSGMENINTSKLEYMDQLFQFCTNLKSVDFSGFNTAKVTDMTRLFWGCENLAYVLVGENWNTTSVTKSAGMFEDCSKLYGGKGTAYNADITDVTYARIDGGTETPGYLTKAGETIYKILTSIAVTTSPKTEYTEGDNFSTEEGILTLTYNTGETETVNLSEATITGYDKTKLGEQTLKVEYQGVETTLAVTVKIKKALASIEVTTLPKTVFAFGENFSAANGVMTLTYNTGETRKVNLSAATITGYDQYKRGEQTLTITYQGVETTLTVTVGTTTPVSDVANSQDNVKVWSFNSTIYIETAPDTKYTIIDLNGRILKASTTKSTNEEIKINQSGIVVVVINGASYKLAL